MVKSATAFLYSAKNDYILLFLCARLKIGDAVGVEWSTEFKQTGLHTHIHKKVNPTILAVASIVLFHGWFFFQLHVFTQYNLFGCDTYSGLF